jgi:hypothetical protein
MMKRTSKKNTQDEPDHDPWFNPYRQAATDRAQVALGGVLYEFEQQEQRKRARKEKDRLWLWQLGYALLADLAYHHLSGSPGTGLVVPRAKRALGKPSRYHPPFFTRTFPKLLDAFEGSGYLVQKKGEYSGNPAQSRRTTIRAGAKLIALIEEHQLTLDDLGLGDDEEVIILKRAKRDHWDKGERIEYKDNETTRRLREEVRAVNRWLEAADITFDPSTYDRPVDTRSRRLYRYFANGDFKSGGRLFRGFWENLPKQARLRGLRIDGEHVIELDYAQLNPMLCYAKVGCVPPLGDAYELPGLEQHRAGVKKVFNALLFDTGLRKSFPRDTNVLFPPKTKVRDVIRAIRRKHPDIHTVLSTGAGFGLMYLESEIMMRVLESLQERGIVGLPVFDAVIVKASKADEAMAVMQHEFDHQTGLEIQVRWEPAHELEEAPSHGDLVAARSVLVRHIRARAEEGARPSSAEGTAYPMARELTYDDL